MVAFYNQKKNMLDAVWNDMYDSGNLLQVHFVRICLFVLHELVQGGVKILYGVGLFSIRLVVFKGLRSVRTEKRLWYWSCDPNWDRTVTKLELNHLSLWHIQIRHCKVVFLYSVNLHRAKQHILCLINKNLLLLFYNKKLIFYLNALVLLEPFFRRKVQHVWYSRKVSIALMVWK